ncbi:DUF3489 domain-containing protein [Novosphingobium sp. MW5]|nr:DUF3489 domain-containing protein [Novosphingobium sp. MW5]
MTNSTEANADAKQGTKRPRKMAREPNQQAADQALPARQTKTDLVLDLLRRPEGVTIDQLVAATGWLPHTTRAALTGLKKKGRTIVSEKSDGIRSYRIDGVGAA